MTQALLLVDHGSRLAEANAQLDALAALVRARTGGIVRLAHLELASPTIAEGFEACVADGAAEVVVVPVFLAPGRHAGEDIPRIAAEAAARHGVAGASRRSSARTRSSPSSCSSARAGGCRSASCCGARTITATASRWSRSTRSSARAPR
ncbi:MAG: hypothetical protein M5U28_52225 [Sandaracinaceae bacterium]|nr:hypothetical protein [Sandaracinaceae bacterium]